MIQLVPTPDVPDQPVDPVSLYLSDERPALADRPWVVANMVASVDGATTLSGVSGGLGGAADKLIFHTLRAAADWILVAASTARVERYQIPTVRPEMKERRNQAGRPNPPRLAVVTASANIGVDLPMFANRGADQEPAVVITGTDALPEAVEILRSVAEVVVIDKGRPTPTDILDELFRRQAGTVLTEGGPSFLGQLVAADVVDELCITTSPLLINGESYRIAHGTPVDEPRHMHLDRLLALDSELFARYVRQR